MEEYALKNGLQLYYYPTNAYSIVIGLYVKAGSRYETPKNNGISHLLEHMHFQKLGEMMKDEIYHLMESEGTSLCASTNTDLTKYYVKIYPTHLKNILPLFKGVIETYDWTEEQFMSEKKVVINQILENNKCKDLEHYQASLLWGNNPLSYPVVGTKESVEAITLEQLIDYKKKMYCIGNIAFFITGNISNHDISSLNNFFSEISIKRTSTSYNYLPPKIGFRKPDIKLINIGGYLDILLSFDANLEIFSHDEITVLDSIIGGGTGAMLQKRLREELGYTSNIYSYFTSHQSVGYFTISYSCSRKNLTNSLKAIIEILNETKSCILEKELSTNRPFFTDNLWFWLEDNVWFNDKLAWEIFIHGLRPYSIENKIEVFRNITSKDLTACAEKLFTLNNISLIIAGGIGGIPKKNILDIISTLGTA
jgi:predicted Zn-dependent peptidase